MELSAEIRLVVVTTDTYENAKMMSRALISSGLAACCSIVPEVTSIYNWEGTTEEAGECMIIIKTTANALAELESRILELHPYEVPEIISMKIDAASAKYYSWVLGAVRGVM